MRFDKNRQWVGAVYAEDLRLVRQMLAEDPALGDSAHAEFDDRRVPAPAAAVPGSGFSKLGPTLQPLR